jgi:Asp-tRNA(Asn)/Glu-tRNA(Gln) amidotransferase A subunit family amidase
MGMNPLWRPWSLRELTGRLAVGATTPAEALARSRARIAETEPELHAWVEHAPEPETATGPLHGVPLGVKDIVDLAGLPTRCGTPLRAEHPPATADAAIVTAWRAAGATPVGKTVSTEFAYFSPGPTDNPAAPGHTPGGSSSGSAAAVASGQVPLALGSQTAGSITRPGSFCGIASLVLTHGRFAMDGVLGLSPSLDSHGFYAAEVTDLALAWSALAGEPDPGPRAGHPPRLLVWTAASLDVVHPEQAASLATAGERLAEAGAVVEEFPDEELVAELVAAHPVVMAYEAARERADELAVVDRISPQLADLLRTGANTPERDYETARRTVALAIPRVAELLARYDAVLGPAAPGPPPEGLMATGDPVLSRPWQALGLPAVGVPGRRSTAGHPLGLQLVGRSRGETALLAAGCWVENALRP